MILNTENVNIKTAIVEIKTLTVNGRQVTKALFKQIPYEEIFNDHGELKGIIWGHVNDFLGNVNIKLSDARHLIWQEGNYLKRCVIYSPMNIKSTIRINEKDLRNAKLILSRIKEGASNGNPQDYEEEIKRCEEAINYFNKVLEETFKIWTIEQLFIAV